MSLFLLCGTRTIEPPSSTRCLGSQWIKRIVSENTTRIPWLWKCTSPDMAWQAVAILPLRCLLIILGHGDVFAASDVLLLRHIKVSTYLLMMVTQRSSVWVDNNNV